MKEYKNKCLDCNCRVDNRTKRCMSCHITHKESTKEQRLERTKERQRKWYQENKPRLLIKAVKRSKLLTFEKRKSGIIKHKYGIDIRKFDSMLEEQSNKCKICGKQHTKEKPLHIDHCHISKKVRGLLCNKCNHGLGFFGDDIKLMKNAIKYLEDV